ncbi:hypothetical protein P9112_013769 [Eukaryota sp. TZLM1-RC]
MSDTSGKDTSDFIHSPNMQHQQGTQQQHTTYSEDIQQYKLPAWFDREFDNEIHNYAELTGALTSFEEFMEQKDSSESDMLEQS